MEDLAFLCRNKRKEDNEKYNMLGASINRICFLNLVSNNNMIKTYLNKKTINVYEVNLLLKQTPKY